MERNSIVTMFVHNILKNLHWSGLRQVFGRHGDIVSSFIARKADRLGKRFGFVGFSSKADAEKAIKRLNGFILYGSKISVSIDKAVSKTPTWRKSGVSQNQKGIQTSQETCSTSKKPSYKKVVKRNLAVSESEVSSSHKANTTHPSNSE
ncbi:hypothetical protein V6N13_088700 [Hibiscus sabdariffa]